MRNPMAMIYGYLFPLIFLVAFWAIYRADRVPIALHLGELLTVTVLGGACFGLPTTMVSERERGVWRRYRLTPLPGWAFLASTLVTRYLLLLSAALIQLALALAIGMPMPAAPAGLLIAFTCAAIAFMGLGLVIAQLADGVPAVQALGQCIFLPMLMIGGVAVRLASLPDWAQHLSAFFPGRYAVEAIQAAATGRGLAGTGFALAALLLIGLSAGIAAALMFRWDAGKRGRTRKGWLMLALAMWVAVGLVAEWRGRVVAPPPVPEEVSTGREYVRPVAPVVPAPAPAPAAPAAAPAATGEARPSAPPAAAAPAAPASWQAVTPADIANVDFLRLPNDQGIIAPFATLNELPDPVVADQVAEVRAALANWTPGKAADPVQRARNLLFVAAVPDALQMEGLERFLPWLVYERLRADIPREDLPKILYWIATHPNDGDDAAARQLGPLGLPETPVPSATARTRVMLYAFKLLGRTTGAIVQK
nr:ABC transporter permease [Sphingomonas quercus]